MADALGLATSMSSGLLAFLADGGWSKWLHTGWSAHGGIIAAELASHGFRGPHHGLDHQYGLYGAFLGKPGLDLDAVTAGLGSTWLGAAASPKGFPCAHVIHPYIEAALALRAEGKLDAENVASVTCVMAPWALPIVAVPRAAKIAPRNDLEAIASLPFMVAAALCDGRVDLATLRPQTLGRADILALAARIDCAGDDRLGSGFDGELNAVLRDGSHISRGATLSAAGEDQIVAKFRTNAANASPDACAVLEHTLLNDAPSGRDLVRLALAALSQRRSAVQ
jgi:2-methylcitrate dehydratase PrpD